MHPDTTTHIFTVRNVGMLSRRITIFAAGASRSCRIRMVALFRTGCFDGANFDTVFVTSSPLPHRGPLEVLLHRIVVYLVTQSGHPAQTCNGDVVAGVRLSGGFVADIRLLG